MSPPPASTPALRLRISDVLLAVLFSALLYLAHDNTQRWLLSGLAVLQLVEGRLSLLDKPWGRALSLVFQLTLGFILIGWSRGIESPYYLVLLLPVISTAAYPSVAAGIISPIAAIATYLSFLFIGIDWTQITIDDESVHILAIRCMFLAIAAVLVNSLGYIIRRETARYKIAAELLAEANRNLMEAEAAVRRSERLAAMGQLTAGLAHELRNPLSSIKGSADLLARSAATGNPVTAELAGIISSEVDRTNLLVTRFLDFARPLEPRREVCSLTDIIERAAGHAGVAIIRQYSPAVPPLSLDPALMEQVFINLFTNASQASPPGAPVTVATRIDKKAKADFVEISVTDIGFGIPPDKIESIFNPFVTTKQDGVGLGLPIVSKIVDRHGGKMTVESKPGKGSTFRISLPIQK